MPGDLAKRRDRLPRQQPFHVSGDFRYGDRLVDVDDAGERRQVGNAGVAGVQHAELVELPVVDAVGEEDADVLPAGPSSCEHVFDYPLAERLAYDRPAVVNASLA
jgi:hypothetical protein